MNFRFLFFCIGVFILQSQLNAQNCIPNTLSSIELGTIPNSTSGIWRGVKFNNLVDVSIFKTGTGPDLIASDASKNGVAGIWIGENNAQTDYSDITLVFSKPIVSLSFGISSINNDEYGQEEVRNISVFDSLLNNISNNVNINWKVGANSGIFESDTKATRFLSTSRTIIASKGFCCNNASGRLTINSSVPFTKITFRHQEISRSISTANGIILTGDMIFCVFVPKIEKQITDVKSKLKSPIKIKKTAIKKDSIVKIVNEKARHILFKKGKAEFLDSSFTALDDLILLLKNNERIKFELQGHTDNVGDADANLRLSIQRVELVSNYFYNNGVDKNRIKAKGFGGTKPLFNNDSEENRRKNRRVTIIVNQ